MSRLKYVQWIKFSKVTVFEPAPEILVLTQGFSLVWALGHSPKIFPDV